MGRSTTRKTTEALVDELNLVVSAPAALHTALGLTTAQLAAGTTAITTTVTATHDQTAAIAQVAQFTQAKRAGKALVVASLNEMMETARKSAATDAELAAVGFPPRRTTPARPTFPLPATDLKVEPFADGTALVTFSKNGNRASALYGIEVSGDGLNFEPYLTTTRCRERLGGFAPGQPCWFRVVARNSMGAAAPSATVPIYAPLGSAKVELKLAA